jgi:predicted phosphodiesterase
MGEKKGVLQSSRRSKTMWTRLGLLPAAILVLSNVSSGAIVKLGILADIHSTTRAQVDNYNGNNRYYSQAKAKTEKIIDDFVAVSVDVITELGDLIDYGPYDVADGTLDSICASLKQGSGGAPHGIPVYYVLGNHECTYQDKSTFLTHPSVSQTGSRLNYPAGNGAYGYFEIGNVRCFILDTNYSSRTESYPSGSVTYAYLSDAQLAWLDSALADADAQGKFSVAFFHHGVGIASTALTRIFVNWEDLVNVVKRHRVVFVAFGHTHTNSHSRNIANNSLGQPILFTAMEAVVDGNQVPDANNTAGAIVRIDDRTGAVDVQGLYNNEDGRFVHRFVNAAGDNSDGLSEASAWTTLTGAIANIKNDLLLYDPVTERIRTHLTLWIKGKQTPSSTVYLHRISGDPNNGYRFIIRGYGQTIYDANLAEIDGGGMNGDIIRLSRVSDVELRSLEVHNTTDEGSGICFVYGGTVDSRIAVKNCKFYDVYHTILAEENETLRSRMRSLLIDRCTFGPPRSTYGNVRTEAISTIFTNNFLDGYSSGASAKQVGLYVRDCAGGGRQFAIIGGNIFKNCSQGVVIGTSTSSSTSTFDGIVYMRNNVFYEMANSGVFISAPGAEIVGHSNIYVVEDKVSDTSVRRLAGSIFSSDYSISSSWMADALKNAGENHLVVKDEQVIAFVDPNNDDFRLGRSSVALNTGEPTVLSGKINQGAYQGLSLATVLQNDCVGWSQTDFNFDCRVDFRDLAIFSQSWLDCNLNPPEMCRD